jgi:hypothetical protein
MSAADMVIAPKALNYFDTANAQYYAQRGLKTTKNVDTMKKTALMMRTFNKDSG